VQWHWYRRGGDAGKEKMTNPDDIPKEEPRFAVRHYSVAEVAGLWSLSPDFVRRIFQKEPGVLVLGDENPAPYKRRYRTLRIPEFVLARVHRRLSRR
jgi:hypothetical protein